MGLYWRIKVVCRRFRWFLSSPAEWCILLWIKKGKKMDGGQKMSVNGTLYPAVHLFPLVIIDSVHHSAANAMSERNLKRHIVLFS